MHRRLTALAMVICSALALLLATGCREEREAAESFTSAVMSSSSTRVDEKEARYWEPRGSGSAVLAWKQQTRFHKMFTEKYDSADEKGKERLQQELEKVYFRTNGVLVQLFEDAISDDPKEPVNYISYGLYLLPRSGQFENAISLIEKGMNMERDNAGFHFLLAHAYVAPLRSGEFSSSVETDAIRYKRYQGKFEIELERARKLMPENAFFDYYEAIMKYRFEDDLDAAWKLIEQGNEKPQSYFILPPPIAMLTDSWATEFNYPNAFHLYWNFGCYPEAGLTRLAVDLLTSDMVKNSPSRMFDLARFVFHASQTRPYDRLYHFLLGLAVEQALDYYSGLGSEKKVEQMKQVRSFYDEVTSTMDDLLREEGTGDEPGATLPANLLNLEVRLRRQYRALNPLFPIELRLMKKLRETLGLDAEKHPLFDELWRPV